MKSGPVTGTEHDGAPVWLATLKLSVAAVLELDSSPWALWSESREECAFNSAVADLLAFGDAPRAVSREWWLAHVDTADRQRLSKSWESLETSGAKMVCRYRFWPLDGSAALQLEENAVRLRIDGPQKCVVLCRYEVMHERQGKQPRAIDSSSAVGKLAHKIGNSLQAVRGEVDLLRLAGGLPQQSFERINNGIESIHQLVGQLEALIEMVSSCRRSGAGRPASDAAKHPDSRPESFRHGH